MRKNTFLDELVLETQKRIEHLEPIAFYKDAIRVLSQTNTKPFYEALSKPGLSLIAEIKKASPSKGIICENFEPLKRAQLFEKSKASALSVLTEPHFFKGNLAYLERISKQALIPTLRKDFILDARQIYEAKLAGASAILLIVSILDEKRLQSLFYRAKELDLDVIVEVHHQDELEKAFKVTGLNILGVNNRDLMSFETDTNRVLDFLPYIKSSQSDCLVVAESGYSRIQDLETLERQGIDAVLIGEGLVKDPKLLDYFKK